MTDDVQTPAAAANEPAPHEASAADPAVSSPAAETPVAAPSTDEASAPMQEPTSEREGRGPIRIGSQRSDSKGGGAPKHPQAKPQRLEKGADVQDAPRQREEKREKIAPPNIRQGLSDELQREYEAALGGGSLDDLLSPTSAAPSHRALEEGSEQTGRVMSMREESVFVDLGGRDQGVVSVRQFKEAPEVGQEVKVRVVGFQPEDGLYELALPGAAIDSADWSSLAEGTIVDAIVTGHNKGGLDVEVNKIRGFIPISQVSLYRVEDLTEFVGQKFTCVVTEANSEKRNLVLSRRAMLEREREAQREELLQSLEVGQVREGIVRKLEKFGAFVDIGGIDGLVHISQLSWDHVRHPSEVLAAGQKIRVRVEKIDPASGKIGLGYRDLFESPWLAAAEKYPPQSKVKGTIAKLAEFGAFIKLEPGVEGLVHVSEIAHHRISRPADYLQQGQEVEAVVLAIDPDKQRLSLSIKALTPRTEKATKSKEQEEPEVVFEPKLSAKERESLKGGVDRPSGGEQFGLKW